MPNLLVDIAELTRSQRDRIAAAAGARGWEAHFASGAASRFLAVNADQAPEQVTEEAFQALFARMTERGVV